MKKNFSNHLATLGIQTWQQRIPCVAKKPSQNLSNSNNWDTLKNAVASCTACSLHQNRTQTVFGVGNQTAELMIIGEAPGFYEDQKGEPFVGRAGQLLNAMLHAIELDRANVYIANILKCRPPENRDPLPDEVALCTNYLVEQIALIKPHLMLAVGRIAAHYLLQTKASLESLRNKVHLYGTHQTPLIVTYHPAYLLRNPKDKAKALVDLNFAQRTLDKLSISAGENKHGRTPQNPQQKLCQLAP